MEEKDAFKYLCSVFGKDGSLVGETKRVSGPREEGCWILG